MSKLKYVITLYDKDKKETFRLPFYLEENSNYRTVLLQMVDELRNYNLEIDTNNMTMILLSGKNPRENTILLEREK
jgi:hypothetical protein